jgi:hypothetical protein
MLRIYVSVSGVKFDAKGFQLHPALPEPGAIGETRGTDYRFPKKYYWKSQQIDIGSYDDEETLNYVKRYQDALLDCTKFSSDSICLTIYARYMHGTMSGYYLSNDVINILSRCGASIDIDQYFDEDSN